MFCPECGAEYRPGFTRCASCEVELVESLSDEDSDADGQGGSLESDPSRSDLVLLGDVANRYDAAAIAERFELESVPYVLQYGSAMSHLEGKRLFARRETVWRGLLWVDSREVRRARSLFIEVLKEQEDEALRGERDS